MWRLKEHFNISVNAASSVSVKSDTVHKTNVFIQQMFTCAVLKFQWQRRYRWGFPNCIELRIVHIPILPFNSYQDLLSLYSIPFIIWYNNNDDMKFFRVKSKLFYLAADHFFYLRRLEQQTVKRKTGVHVCSCQRWGVGLIPSFLQCPSLIFWIKLSKIECWYYFDPESYITYNYIAKYNII